MKQDTASSVSKLQDLLIQCLGIVAVFILILMSVWSFKQQTQKFSREASTDQLTDIAQQTTNSMRMKIQDSISYLTGATGYFSGFDDLRCYQAMQMLDKLAKVGGFYGIRLVTPDGKGYASMQNVVDLSQRDYFKKAMCGEIGMSNTFIAYAPIYKDRRIVGCLCGLYNMDSLDETRLSSRSETIPSYVFEKNGNLVLRDTSLPDSFLNCGNVWLAFQNVQFKKDTGYQQFYKSVQKEIRGSFQYVQDGKTHLAYYAPIGVNDLFTLQIISESKIFSYQASINDMAFVLIVKVICSFIILIVAIIYFNHKSQQELLNSNQRLDLITNAIPGGVLKCSTDEKGEFLYLSDGFVRMFEYSRDEICNHFQNSFYHTIYQPDTAMVRKKLSHPKLGEVIDLEYRIQTASGQLLWMLNKVSLMKDKQGAYFYCVCLDITRLKTTQQELQMSNERFRISIANTSNVVFEYDLRKNQIVFVTKTRMLYALPEIIKYPSDGLDWNGSVFAESVQCLNYALKKIQQGAKTASGQIKMHRCDGKTAWNQVTLTNLYNDSGQPIRAIGMLEDITDHKIAELRYQKEKQYRAAILADMQEVYEINLTNNRFVIVFGNKRKKRKLELPSQFTKAIPILIEEIIYLKDRELVKSIFSVEHLLHAFHNGNCTMEYQYRDLDQEGNVFWVHNRVNLLKDPQTGHIKAFSYVRDIDQQKRKEMKLKFESQRDPLTKLYNRSACENNITAFLKSEELNQGNHGFLAIDLDNFKLVNDHFGHLAGDELLINIAKTMQDVFRATDILARMGGDEFVVFMKGARTRQHIIKKANELVDALQRILPEKANGMVSASIGIAFAPLHGDTFEQLYLKADKALYHVKRNGKNCCSLYNDSLGELPKIAGQKNTAHGEP